MKWSTVAWNKCTFFERGGGGYNFNILYAQMCRCVFASLHDALSKTMSTFTLDLYAFTLPLKFALCSV